MVRARVVVQRGGWRQLESTAQPAAEARLVAGEGLPSGTDEPADRPTARLPTASGAPAPDDGEVVITVVLMGELKRLAGRRELEVRLGPGATVDDVGRGLRDACPPAFAARVLTPDGGLQHHVAVFRDGVQLPTTRDGSPGLAGGRLELMLVPMYEGG